MDLIENCLGLDRGNNTESAINCDVINSTNHMKYQY